jgi:hypothetical protein
MAKKLLYLLFLLCGLSSLTVMGQKKPVYMQERSILYKNELSGGILIHSSGMGAGIRRGYHVTGDRKRVFEADLLSMKHPKEYKVNSYYDNGQSYVFGKDRGLLVLRGGYGFQNVLFNKGERGGVEIRYIYFAGLSLGITKPIYYQVFRENEVVEERFSASLTHPQIYNKASFFRGLEQMSIHPGAYGKFGFSFEYGAKDVSVKAIEVGTALDAYPVPVPIMALIDNKRLFLTFYIQVLWGKKW